MTKASPSEDLNWLSTDPRLEELMDRYPEVWEEAGRELVLASQSGRVQNINECAARARSLAETWRQRIKKSGGNSKVIESALPHLAKSRMLALALDRSFLASAAGKVTGKVRFTLLNGLIIQKLLFSHDFVRKAASMRLFRFWWRFVTQKKLLIPMVQDKGIYCFYSKDLIRALVKLIDGRLCVEIGAGDGTLARLLKDEGVNIVATDDYSWSHAIVYPENVENLGARQSLSKYQPQVVICSWPPPGNSFERQVFLTKSVELYIVIGSRFKFVSGNWDAYKEQDKFEWAVDEKLTSFVIPPELEKAVLVFRRKTS